ncbi:MAG TPA: DNA-binding protein [Nitrospirae bacterium]|nr:DNA-binding protein [Nitrospirota bacterium]
MPQSKILLDSASYIRLARSIHPLLSNEFGKDNYCLYVLPEFEKEFQKNAKLQSRFGWVNDSEHKDNRSNMLALSRKEKKNIEITKDFILDYAVENQPGISKVDIAVLSYSYTLNIPLATDDSDMIKVAKYYNIVAYKTLELIRLMLDYEHIDMKKVEQIASYWIYVNDQPKDFARDYKKLFKKPLPKPSH